MQKLFSNRDKKLLTQVDKLEKELQQFICDNWQALFPQYTFIAQEFVLKGEVHALGSGGRIDILAYNPATKRFVFFELKRDYGKNIGHQAANYRCYIHRNFLTVYVDALQKYMGTLPDKAALNEKEVEVILIAKEFFTNQISQAESESLVTLIEYNWFENDLVLFDYVHVPDTVEPETGGTKSIIKEPYKNKDWHYIVKTIQKVGVREALQAIPFPPATKEQYNQLKSIVVQVPNPDKQTALQKRLDALEFGTETEDAI